MSFNCLDCCVNSDCVGIDLTLIICLQDINLSESAVDRKIA